MRICFILFCLILTGSSLFGQHTPQYSQYLLNPYVYNPAYAGGKSQYELHLNHRRQWVGINQAPVVSTITFQTSINPGWHAGLKVYNFTRGLITSNSAQLGIGYHARLGPQHGIRFGLSGGFSSTGLDFSKVSNPNDPAILTGLDNRMTGDAQFGINYNLYGLNLGLTLSSLLNKSSLRPFQEENSIFNPFNSYIINADYKFLFKQYGLTLQPYLLYHVTPETSLQWEGGSLLFIQEKVHIGGSFRQNYGPTAMTGFALNPQVTLGYGYEFASQLANTIGQGSHEIQLSIRFGKMKSEKKAILAKSPEKEHSGSVNQIKKNSSRPPAKKKKTVKNPETTAKPQQAVTPTAEEQPQEPEPASTKFNRGTHPDELPFGYFVVVGVFSNKTNAGKAIAAFAQKGFETTSGYSSQTKYYYVYVYHSDDIESCIRIRNDYRVKEIFKGAWLLEIKE